ncbi:MAG: hypothetical protein ACE37B_00775 [Ilumatobacter sp.]|uniref:hypothetical protein n=1 Tax=Ilumatobacter sp. TaxID=1967498 RepID=UPI00391CC295
MDVTRPARFFSPRIHGRRTRMHHVVARCLVVPLLVTMLVAAGSSSASPPPVAESVAAIVYDDALGDGFADWSWAESDLSTNEHVASGSAAIRVDMAPWGALSFGAEAPLSMSPSLALRFSVHGGDNASVTLRVVAMDGSYRAAGAGVVVTAPGDRWTAVSIPFADLGAPTAIGGIWWQDVSGTDPAPIYLDDIVLVAPAAPAPVPGTTPTPETDATWAFEETFDGMPTSPSQSLLPSSFDYVATHRSHPKEHFTADYTPFLADHADDCTGPNPAISPRPQRLIRTTQDSNGSNPDPSFFICHGHMMSSMGDVAGYSVSSFWPRQEFDFGNGGTLEFDVSLHDGHGTRSWWEVMIVPRDELRVAPGPDDAPISERYPENRIVLDFRRNVRTIKVGTGELAPAGWIVNETQRGRWDFAWWRDLHPDDPALDDGRIRRTMRVRLDTDRIVWGIETPDGSFDEWSVEVPGGLPLEQGLVLFKTHAYNPTKDGNLDTYTFHWDDIRFDGPVVGRYDVREADDVVDLQRNGHRPIGDSQTVTIDLEDIGRNPVLFGQIHQPKRGQVLLSLNGGQNVEVSPDQYDIDDCLSTDWKSFRYELDPSQLRVGSNTLTWTVGPRPNCTYERDTHWDGFSVKFLQIQSDAAT